MNIPDRCELCGSGDKLTKHHLIPQVKAKNKYKEIKNDESNLIWVCDLCHRTIHAKWTENELRDLYSTKDALKASLADYLSWRGKHMGFSSNSTKMSNSRRRK